MEIKILSANEAAAFLGMHPMTLKLKARAGEIPAGRSGKKWIFVNVDLIEYIRAQYQDKNKNTDIDKSCPSTNVKIRHTGGSKSNSTENQYAALLGLKNDSARKNTTTN